MRLEYTIQNWCNEAGAAASICRDKTKKILYIYTERPGFFIGRYGSLISKYRDKIAADEGYSVELVETEETFLPGTNYEDVVAARVKAFFETEYIC